MASFDTSTNVGSSFANSRVRSQSDSDLLSSHGSPSAEGATMTRQGSALELTSKSRRRKKFLLRLVRPWKWRKRSKASKARELANEDPSS